MMFHQVMPILRQSYLRKKFAQLDCSNEKVMEKYSSLT
jgi:hypothetical protein